MTTKRRRVTRGLAQRITPEAVAAFVAGDRMQLHRELRLKPWQESPLDAIGESPWPATSAGGSTWPESVQLAIELQQAAAGGRQA